MDKESSNAVTPQESGKEFCFEKEEKRTAKGIHSRVVDSTSNSDSGSKLSDLLGKQRTYCWQVSL